MNWRWHCDDEVQMAPRGAICLSAGCCAGSERQFGIGVGWGSIGYELMAPGALDLRAVGKPELIAQELDALEDCQLLMAL